MFRKITIICLLFALVSPTFAVPVSVGRKLLTETVETAAKKSGKALTPSLRKASEKALLEASKKYGDDVFKIVSHGGLEALEQGGKHGKIFWELCAHAPQAARSLALHADDLLPIARRIGPDFMKLEAHVPGLGKQAITCFGDDAAKFIAKLPADDAAKLIRFGTKADSPRTAKMLFEGCQKTSGNILKHLDGKKIIALGLTASMVTAAYKVSNGIEDGLVEIAGESPEHFTNIVKQPLICMVCLGTLALVWFFFPLRKRLARLVSKQSVPNTKEDNTKQ